MAKSTKKSDTARKLATACARIAQDSNATDVVVMDLRGVSPITDYFVICTGSSSRQMRTVAEQISEYGKGIAQPVWQVAGIEGGDWIVLDFVDVVVHIFDEQHRKYYDLELIWGESPHVRWKRRSPAKKQSNEPEA
jgi:ribosome-associated protein